MSSLSTISDVAINIRRAAKLAVTIEYPGFISVVTASGELYNIGDVNDTWNADHFRNEAAYEAGEAGDWVDLVVPRASEDARAIARAFLTYLLAVEFGRILRQWVSPTQLAAINARNASENTGTDVCASHDVCDANMAMAEAFARIGLSTGVDLADSDLTNASDDEGESAQVLWNNAWKMAKEGNFALLVPSGGLPSK